MKFEGLFLIIEGEKVLVCKGTGNRNVETGKKVLLKRCRLIRIMHDYMFYSSWDFLS